LSCFVLFLLVRFFAAGASDGALVLRGIVVIGTTKGKKAGLAVPALYAMKTEKDLVMALGSQRSPTPVRASSETDSNDYTQ